jgi:hypothetical protein
MPIDMRRRGGADEAVPAAEERCEMDRLWPGRGFKPLEKRGSGPETPRNSREPKMGGRYAAVRCGQRDAGEQG